MKQKAGYDKRYYKFIATPSLDSARVMLPFVVSALEPRSVCDFGCGAGAWLRVWKELGVTDIVGVDGDYVDRNSLLIAREEFIAADLTKEIRLGRQVDLACSLEVAEHLPPKFAEVLVHTLTRHASRVLFSAAVPGQGGYQHINERPLEYWRELFAQRRYAAFDFLRPKLLGLTGIERWYALNTMLYVAVDAAESLPDQVFKTRVKPEESLKDFTPVGFRLRKTLLRRLPVHCVNLLHSVKKRAVLCRRAPKLGLGSGL